MADAYRSDPEMEEQASHVTQKRRRAADGPPSVTAPSMMDAASAHTHAPTHAHAHSHISSSMDARDGGLSIRKPATGIAHMPSAVEFSGRFEDTYVTGEPIGHGTFSIVRLCTHTPTGEKRAVKIIDTRKFKLSSAARATGDKILDEVRILRTLSAHPGVIRLHDVYDQQWEGHEAILLVSEYAPGGELFDSIIKAGNFTEPQARHVLWQALQAVAYMHSKNIIHRDLKPENLLVFSATLVPALDPVVRPGMPTVLPSAVKPSDGSTVPMLNIKIADFGVARYLGAAAHASGASTFVGSPQYVAPEVLMARENRHGLAHSGPTSYGKAVDVYSLGVILYVCLAGYLPFDDNAPRPPEAPMAFSADGSPETWDERAKAGRFYFAPPVWTHISAQAKDLIRHMMAPKPEDRFSVEQALAHPWFEPVRRAFEVPQPAMPMLSAAPSISAGSPVPDISRLSLGAHPGGSGVAGPALSSSAWARAADGTILPLTTATPPSVVQPVVSMPVGASVLAAALGGAAPGAVSHPVVAPSSFTAGGAFAPTSSAAPARSSARSEAPAGGFFSQPQPRLLLTTGSTASNFSPQSDTTGSDRPAPETQGSRQFVNPEVFETVARSMDFDSLLRLQRSIATTFATAYDAVRDIPKAAMVIRRHAVACRELQHRVRQVIQRCRTLAQAITAILPDLQESVTVGDAELTRAIFARMKEWVSELKAEAQQMQAAYNQVIVEVQMSIEQARTLQLDLHNHPAALNGHGSSDGSDADAEDRRRGVMRPHPAVQAIGDADGDAGSSASTPHAGHPPSSMRSSAAPAPRTGGAHHTHSASGHSMSASVTGATPVSAPGTPPPAIAVGSSPAVSAFQLSATGAFDARHHASPHRPSSVPPDTSVASPSLSSGSISADDVLELFLDTPAMIANDRRMKHVTHGLGIDMNAGAMPGAVSGGAAWQAGGSAPGPLRTESDIELPDVGATPTPNSGVHAPGTQVVRYFASNGDESASGTSQALTHAGEHAGGEHKCLGCALAELRALDAILTRAVTFWASLEAIIDVVVRRKEHSETLLRHSSSSRMLAKATQSLHDYENFWNAFAVLCGEYSSHSIAWTQDMYSWLTAPDVPLLAAPGTGGTGGSPAADPLAITAGAPSRGMP